MLTRLGNPSRLTLHRDNRRGRRLRRGSPIRWARGTPGCAPEGIASPPAGNQQNEGGGSSERPSPCRCETSLRDHRHALGSGNGDNGRRGLRRPKLIKDAVENLLLTPVAREHRTQNRLQSIRRHVASECLQKTLHTELLVNPDYEIAIAKRGHEIAEGEHLALLRSSRHGLLWDQLPQLGQVLRMLGERGVSERKQFSLAGPQTLGIDV
jgi:hypothetical protein